MSGALVHQAAFPGGQELTDMRNAASLISQSGLVPEAFRGKPADVMVAILTARGLGLDPMVALQKGYVVKGKFDIEVSVKLGLIQSRVPDFDYEIVTLDDERCVIEGGRAGKNKVRAEFTYAQAVAAGLTTSKYGDKETWKFYRRDMMLNRALGRVLKLTCAAALYNMPVRLDEDDDVEPTHAVPQAASRPASSAEVVVEGAASAQSPGGTAGMSAVPDSAAPFSATAASQPVPEDWLGRLLNAIRAHYGIKADVPDALPGRNKWLKAANGQKGDEGRLVRLLNLFYESVGAPAIDGWLSVPPMDYEAIALWLEAHAAKRAGAGAAGSEGTDALPAQSVDAGAPESERESAPAAGSMAPQPASEAVVVEDDEDPGFPTEDEGEPAAASGHEWLAAQPLGHVVNVMFAMKQATKGERVFVERSPKGNWALRDDRILKDCCLVDENGIAKPVWMHKAFENKPLWALICRAVVEQADALKVSYTN